MFPKEFGSHSIRWLTISSGIPSLTYCERSERGRYLAEGPRVQIPASGRTPALRRVKAERTTRSHRSRHLSALSGNLEEPGPVEPAPRGTTRKSDRVRIHPGGALRNVGSTVAGPSDGNELFEASHTGGWTVPERFLTGPVR